MYGHYNQANIRRIEVSELDDIVNPVKGQIVCLFTGEDSNPEQVEYKQYNGSEWINLEAAGNILDVIAPAMVMKGTIGQDGTIQSLPTASYETVGDTYKVLEDASYTYYKNNDETEYNVMAHAGDLLVCYSVLTDQYDWMLIPSGNDNTDTGATSIGEEGSGNAYTDARYDADSRQIILSKNNTFVDLDSSQTIEGSKTFVGQIYLQDSINSNISAIIANSGGIKAPNIVPHISDVIDLGNSTNKWNKIYLNSSIETATRTLYVDQIIDGVGLTENTIVLGNNGSNVKSSGITIANTVENSASTIPTSQAVVSYIESKNFTSVDEKVIVKNETSSTIYVTGAYATNEDPQTLARYNNVYIKENKINADAYQIKERVSMYYDEVAQCIRFSIK